MNLNKICLPTACWAIALSLTTLHAQQAGDPAESRFQRLDTNGDGLLSKEEWMQTKAARKNPKRADKSFARLDQNGDGQISKEEFASPKKEGPAQDQDGAKE